MINEVIQELMRELTPEEEQKEIEQTHKEMEQERKDLELGYALQKYKVLTVNQYRQLTE